MGTGYTRQSSAEIVDGQVIFASDFNNEFDAIVAAFHATTGHAHDGTTGEGPLISLTAAAPGVTGVLGAPYGGIHTAAANPTATDDTPDHAVGSLWVNTSTEVVFVCIKNTANNARWLPLPAVTITGATSPPTVNEDITSGYKEGSIIVNTTQDVIYVCVDNTDGAAIWLPLASGRTGSGASAPTVNDDVNDGYKVGSVYVETTSPSVYVCTSATAGAAIWQSVTFNVGLSAMIAKVFGNT